MSYLARLKGDFSEKPIPNELTKPTKAPSVSFVSAPSKHISEIEAANGLDSGEIAADPTAETRRQRVLRMLRENPTITYAMVTDTSADPETVILVLAIRDKGACEILIPRDRYDGMLLLDLIERHGATVH